ncbi:MAG: WD40 repeat domain-containing protein [Anaerolineales bacterium]|jgi:WD40 repeat protein
MQILVIAHQWVRWVVLLAGIIALINLIIKIMTNARDQDLDRRLITIFQRTLEVQTALGLILLVRAVIVDDPRLSRIFLHSLIGIIGVGVLFAGRKRETRWQQKSKSRNRLIITSIALIFILGGMFLITTASSTTFQPISVLEGHQDAVRSVVFSPDSQILASGSFDKTIRLWNISDGTLINTLEGNNEAIRGVAFSPDGSLLASVSFDQRLKIWTIPEGNLVHDIKAHTASINKVLFLKDGYTIITASLDNTIRYWDVNNGELIKELSDGHTGGILSIASSPDDRFLASGGIDYSVRVHNADGDLMPFFGTHANWVYDVAYSPDGATLASSSTDTTVELWDVDNGENLGTLVGHEGAVQTLAFSPDSKLLASGSGDSTIKIWKLDTKQLLTTLNQHNKGVLSITFSPDGKWFASGSADQTVLLWKLTP